LLLELRLHLPPVLLLVEPLPLLLDLPFVELFVVPLDFVDTQPLNMLYKLIVTKPA